MEHTASTTALDTPPVEKRPRATLAKIGNRIVSSDGRLHPNLAADYLVSRESRWTETTELARMFYGSNTDANRRRVRHSMYRIFHAVLDRGRLLAIETHARLGHQRCKIYNPRVPEEKQFIVEQLDRLERQKLLRAERLHKARTLVDCLDAAVTEA